MKKAQFLKEFDKIKRRIEKDRDDLRKLLDEATDILETCEQASNYIQDAADRLSELL
jgi:ABC-type transporter Mla subunit MlaD